jgi:hypothetical protein
MLELVEGKRILVPRSGFDTRFGLAMVFWYKTLIKKLSELYRAPLLNTCSREMKLDYR